MEEALVFDLANLIIGISSSLILPETEPWLNVRDDVDDIRSIVSAIKAKLLDAGERSGTSSFTAWLEKLKDALFDARYLLEYLSFEDRGGNTSFSGSLFSIAIPDMCAETQAVKKRLTSLESEFKIPFTAGTRQQGHFFVHKDEEQSVKGLKVQKELEKIFFDSFSTLWQLSYSGWTEMTRYDIAEIERHFCIAGSLDAEINEPNMSFMSNESKKRNQKFVSDDLLRQKRKGIKKQRQLPYPEESLPSQLQRKPKRTERPLKIFIKGGSAQEMEKFYDDRTERRINNIGKLIYEEWMLESLEMRRMETKASQQNLCYIDQIKKEWLQSDPLAIKQEIQEIDRKHKDAVLTEDEAKLRLLLVGKKIEELDRQRSEFYFAARRYRAIMQTCEEFLSKFRDLENQLYDKDNNKVEYKDFLGLEQALKKTAWGKTPDYLQTIATRIEKARGKATDVFHIPAQVPVCAAIKEMEDFPVEDLDWDTLKKWGATLNYAKKYGFQVGFADNLLSKNLLAYLVIQNLPNSTAKS
ncbi:pentafunctional arom polypeptide [Gossypium australe]|uniref:Pentafunctional arom polypeptide n=1 Tax=Gossypium australe TaxID=47621 RepID=A0A5B6VSR9_9ROSI|nr:pentafunctional arom polypeptide [Gossypium australe]